MARLTYGDVELRHVRTVDFAADPVLSNDGVDLHYTKVTIECTGIFNPFLPMDGSAAPASGDTPWMMLGPALKLYLHKKLMLKRQKLVYQVGNDIVVSVPADGAECDCANGPNPLSARVLAYFANKTA